MQGTLGRTGPVNQIGGAPEPQQEVPALLSKLDDTINQAAMAVDDLITRLGPLRMDALTQGVVNGEIKSEHPKSPIGVDLSEKIDRLRAMTMSVRSIIKELAL